MGRDFLDIVLAELVRLKVIQHFTKTLPSPFTAFITCRKIIRNGMFISFFYSFSLFCGGTWYLAIHVPVAQ